TNGEADIFIRGPDAADTASDLFPNGQFSDSVLEVLRSKACQNDSTPCAADTGCTEGAQCVVSTAVTTLCPAMDVAVAGGRAASLRPESPPATASCPGGSLNPPDADTADLVVQCWPDSMGHVANLGRAASAVAMSPTRLAALVTETGVPKVQVHDS